MSSKRYDWKRQWVPRDGSFVLDAQGFLFSGIQGASWGPFAKTDAVAFDELVTKPLGVLATKPFGIQNRGPAQSASTTLPESLSGLIERVTFHNEDTGFGVLKVKAKVHRDLVTVVGSQPSVSAGEWLTAQGRWMQDREYGQQFRAEMLTSTPPTTKEGIEKYLGSGMVKGIGPIYAKKLVDQFGEGVFDVIEKTSARLEDVDGIGPKRRKRIKEAWDQQKVIREIMLFLHSNGVSSSRAVRIYKTYGEQAIQRRRY
jgi:exodeoxyribonuclease V alpha subunit